MPALLQSYEQCRVLEIWVRISRSAPLQIKPACPIKIMLKIKTAELFLLCTYWILFLESLFQRAILISFLFFNSKSSSSGFYQTDSRWRSEGITQQKKKTQAMLKLKAKSFLLKTWIFQIKISKLTKLMFGIT